MFDGIPKELSRLSQRVARSPLLRRLVDLFAEIRRPPTPAAEEHAGGFTTIVSFGANPGTVRMHLYVPPTTPRTRAPLIALVHGCSQNARDFATQSGWTAMADRIGAVLVLPEQVVANNRGRCFNWFRPGDVKRDSGELLSIRNMVGWASRTFRSDPARTFIVGLSAGGAMALAGLAAYPELFAAGAVVAGMPAGGARGVTTAFALMSGHNTARSGDEWAEAARGLGGFDGTRPAPRLSVWQGTADHTVNSSNADAILAQWTNLRGLPPAPLRERDAGDGVRHRVWEQDGRAVVESWTIEAMAHGYPIMGEVATDQFVLPAPVDATTEIARFWGLLPRA